MKKFSRRDFVPLVGTGLIGASFLSFQSAPVPELPARNLPPALRKGDLVGVCAPAGCVSDPDEIREFTDVLEDNGFKVKLGENVARRWGYFSARDEDRAAEFMRFVKDPEIKAIFFVRGGWGCARILSFLDFESIRQHPKVIMGFSDICSLLIAITEHTGMVTFHGPNGNASWNSRTMEYFHSLLIHGQKLSFHNKAEDLRIRTIVPGIAEGVMTGGNLSVLASMMGSSHLPDWEGKILFLEDLKEEPYRIDRMLTQLKLNGVFEKVNGIVLGVFRDCSAEEPDRAFTTEQLFDQHFKELSIPVYCNAQFGHVVNKFILPIGSKVRVNSTIGTIDLMEETVRK